MPRVADKHLDGRILQAAQRLWRTQGQTGLTLRSVAREAGTTTTTVYKRFRNKEALLVALAQRVRARLSAEATAGATIEECCRRFLHFAEKHPHEYRLLWGPAWRELYGPGRPRPIKDWLLEKFAQRYGGQPQDYERTYYALFFLVHGAASLLIAGATASSKAQIRNNCLAICDALVADAGCQRANDQAELSASTL
jgi:AcrR family transcriptional regulator